MANSVKALINPQILNWARVKSNLTEKAAAKKIGVKEEKISSWESGEDSPTFKQLLKVSEIYKRPVSIFYLEEPPKSFKPLQDFRKLSGLEAFSQTPELSLEIRKAYNRRQIAVELYDTLGEKVPKINKTISLDQNPETVGQEIRDFLGISIDEQLSWKNDYQAFNAWRQAIEIKGILVFQIEKVEVDEVRGFAIGKYPLPVIAVNKKDLPKARIFSLIHELSHILLGDSSISGSDLDDYYFLPPEEKKVEVFCNHVAASTIFPQSLVENLDSLKSFIDSNIWDDESISNFSKLLNISQTSFWRRMQTMGYIDNRKYKEKAEFLRRKFLEAQLNNNKKIIVKPHIKILSSLGRLYPGLVLSSYHQRKITSSALSEYLGAKLRHLPNIEGTIYGGGTYAE